MLPLSPLKMVGSSEHPHLLVRPTHTLVSPVVMGDDVAMDSSPAPDPAQLHFIELDKLPMDNWQSALEKTGIRLEVVQHSYSPGAALSSHAWEKSNFCRQKDICPPEFDPNCFGVPLLWNSADAESEFYGYQVCLGWGKKVAKWIPKLSQFRPNERKEFVFSC